MKYILFSSFFVIAYMTNSFAQSDFEINANNLQVATEEDINLLKKINDFQGGVDGTYSSKIALGCAVRGNARFFIGRNWYPWSEKPEVLCGKMKSYSTRSEGFWGWFERGEEHDWNIYVEPSQPYEHLIAEDFELNKMELELTPHNSLFENPWFKMGAKQSVLTGKTICGCGPWVRDEVHDKHGRKMEIHPSQVIWWTEAGNSAKTRISRFIAIQDYSKRFESHYDCSGIGDNFPPDFEPWVKSPLNAQFKIAFLIKVPSNAIPGLTPFNPMKIKLSTFKKRLVNTKNNDADDGNLHKLKYNGETAIIVEENNSDLDLEVQFVDIKKRENGFIQGYIQINTSVGNVSDKGGYHIITAEIQDSETPGELIGFPEDKCASEKSILAAKKTQLSKLILFLNSLEEDLNSLKGNERKQALRQIKHLKIQVENLKKKIEEAKSALQNCLN